MINKEFIQETDKAIQRIKDRQISMKNSNILVAKVRMEKMTRGGIVLADQFTEVEEFKRGFGRVIALPEFFGAEGDPKLSVGDYIIYTYNIPHYPYPEPMREVLDFYIEDKSYYMVPDNEVLLSLPAEVLHASAL